MKEEELNTLRQQDSALRDALRQEEAELPQMPADLNARVMHQAARQPRKTTVRRLWPWLAAACVAAFIAVNIAPPEDAAPQDKGQVAERVEQKAEKKVENGANGENGSNGSNGENGLESNEPIKPTKPTKPIRTATPAKQQLAVAVAETPKIEPKVDYGDSSPDPSLRSDHERSALPLRDAKNRPHDLQQQLAQVAEPQTEKPTVTLTERDIPITRPENYKYTPEELALMKKQANEAYLKWVELELEIAKHNLEQTAQK